jgi:hypothetical protein
MPNAAETLLASLRDLRREVKEYDPAEARDDRGRWSSGGGSAGNTGAPGRSGNAAPSAAGKAARAALWTAAGITGAAATIAASAAAGALLGERSGNEAIGFAAGTAAGAVLVAGTVVTVLAAKGVLMVSRALSRALGGGGKASNAAGFDREVAALPPQQRARFLVDLINGMSEADSAVVAAALKRDGAATSKTLLAALRAARREIKQYNPDQPRDDHGRWGSGGGSRRSAGGRVPKNSIRAVTSWLSKGSAHELLTGLGLAIAPAVIGFAIEHISAHIGTPMAEAAVHTAVNGLASRLGVIASKALEILRNIVGKLIELATRERASARPAAASKPAAAKPAASPSRPRAVPRGSQRRSAVLAFAARTPGDLDLKTDGAPEDGGADVLSALLAVRDALDAAQP